MKAVLPYVQGMLRPETDEFGLLIGAEPVEMTTESSYFELMEKLWKEGESFLVLEQDILPTLKDYRRMLTCPLPYCIAPYAGPGKYTIDKGLGFTRFRRECIVANPDLFSRIVTLQDSEPFHPHDWRRLDVRMHFWLGTAHLHESVAHLHNYPGDK